MKANRVKLYNIILGKFKGEKRDEWLKKNGEFTQWQQEKFANEDTVSNWYGKWSSKNDIIPNNPTINTFYKDYVCDIVSNSKEESTWGEWVDYCKSQEPEKKLSGQEWFNKQIDDGFFKGGKMTTTKSGNAVCISEVDGLTYYWYPPNKEGKLYYIVIRDNIKYRGEYKLEHILPKDSGNTDAEEMYESRYISKPLLEQTPIQGTEVPYEPGGESEGEISERINSIKSNYFTKELKLKDTRLLNQVVDNVIQAMDSNYKSMIFGQLKELVRLMYRLTSKPEYKYSYDKFENYDDYISDPSQSDITKGEYYLEVPQNLKVYINPNYKIYRQNPTNDDIRAMEVNKENCKTELNLYYEKFQGGFRTTGSQWCDSSLGRDTRKFILECENKGFYRGFLGLGGKMKRRMEELSVGKVGKFTYTNCRINFSSLKESFQTEIPTLNETVKKNLTILLENKKNQIAETTIVRRRFNSILNADDSRKKILGALISESVKMNRVGFDKKIVNENLIDLFKTFFKDDKGSQIIDNFKKEAMNSLLSKINVDENGDLASSIEYVFESQKEEDVAKLLNDCEFLTDEVSKDIVDKMGIKNDTEKNNMERSIKSELKLIICPILNDLTKKMEDKFSEIRDKAMKSE